MSSSKRLSNKILIINGVERRVIFDPEKDSLAVVIRRMGLTGTKIGCGTGVCGACSVLLNGEVIRACTRRMSKVEEYSEILTIEGIGTPQHLHPLQVAWITYGGVQCGFCSPGFIVSAYGLLLKNPSPTREEVRAWFTKHRNICRCTGYKPLVDATMAAAEVMRGEKSIEDITFRMEEGGEYYGSKLPRPTALPKVTGLADFGDDISLKMPGGVAYLAPVMAGIPHGRIRSIDVSAAEAEDGVFRVITAKDVKGTNDISFPARVAHQKGKGNLHFPLICGDVVNRRGDVVALVAASTQEKAREAAKLVKVDYEILPSYMSVLEVGIPGAARIHEDRPNIYLYQAGYKDAEDIEDVFDDADVVVEGSFHTQHEPHLPIEPDVLQAYWGTDGLLTIQCKTHDLYGCRNELAPAIGLPPEKVRMILNPTGGCFGYGTISNVYGMTAVACMALDMPVSMTLTYEEHQHITGKRSASYSNGKLAVSKEGKILGVEYDICADHGAYAGTGGNSFFNLLTVPFSSYYVPKARFLARSGASNHDFAAAYRGFGGPQVYTMSESLIDMAAEKIGMDPWEFRYLNAARPGDTSLNSRLFPCYSYPKLLELIKPYYDEYKKEAEEARAQGRHVGVGMGIGGFNVGKGFIDHAEDALELLPDGKIAVYNTWQDVGQGGDIGTLTHVLKCLSEMNLQPDQVRLMINDTKIDPDSGISAASRSFFMNGRAIEDAAKKLLQAMRKDDGSYRTYQEMVEEGIPTKYFGYVDEMSTPGVDKGIDPNDAQGNRCAAYTYGVNAALVEVNVNNGKTKVLKFTSCVDIGKVGNRLAAEGQGYGGISHSIGYALQEDYDATDKSGNMLYCGVPDCDLIPDDFNLVFYEGNPREVGPHGSSGCAEVFQSSNHMAVINAINNACGVRIRDLPAKPDKVKAAWEALQRGEEPVYEKYYFGSDFEDELEYLLDNPL